MLHTSQDGISCPLGKPVDLSSAGWCLAEEGICLPIRPAEAGCDVGSRGGTGKGIATMKGRAKKSQGKGERGSSQIRNGPVSDQGMLPDRSFVRTNKRNLSLIHI